MKNPLQAHEQKQPRERYTISYVQASHKQKLEGGTDLKREALPEDRRKAWIDAAHDGLDLIDAALKVPKTHPKFLKFFKTDDYADFIHENFRAAQALLQDIADPKQDSDIVGIGRSDSKWQIELLEVDSVEASLTTPVAARTEFWSSERTIAIFPCCLKKSVIKNFSTSGGLRAMIEDLDGEARAPTLLHEALHLSTVDRFSKSFNDAIAATQSKPAPNCCRPTYNVCDVTTDRFADPEDE
ncbi:MAG: hypothetical protein Q9227_004125, partial [Pyrenula ochraceoflavens]